ncbi:phosphoribosyl 1,2-cyclic phosphodiesterase [Rhizobium rhizosphaerae]|uniref:Phosphoribosyl 1,2-cyclic phosphodiesterase n=1 Tax=Xaviernesmea rhizosphaerae TaxID=1672749 RepID=A0ABX3PIZ4_9HYPH|nr:MBL fold metallo-hydrolase [Xaviernesmea rhizosphaerae]OQP88140.1 phosphoribosyl 1,2-cyclic phosphodiesterase [Xaviernesmea rhizosphaerae]
MIFRRIFTILGCGSSPGVPRITGDWGACDPAEPKNRRLRAALLVEQVTEDGGRTSVVIDTGPDFRTQMVQAGVTHLDAAVYTHSHADHLHGIDDLRGYVLGRGTRVPIYTDQATLTRIEEGFSYCLTTPPGGHYPPIIEARLIGEDLAPFVIEGAGGAIPFLPMRQEHGAIHSLGFRIGDFAYCSDVSDFPEETQARLAGLDTLVIDTLQYKPHPSHLSLEQSLGWIERLAPRRAILTHMHIPLDYATVMAETPRHVEPAFDGMTVTYEVTL